MKTVFLVVVILNGTGHGSYFHYHPMGSMDECLKSVESAKIEIAKGGDAEQGFSMYCSTSKHEK